MKPDAVIIEFAVHDSVARFNCSVQRSKANLETTICDFRFSIFDCSFSIGASC